MVKTQEDVKLEKLKHNNEIELLRIKEELAEKDHKRKMERLNIIFETAKLGVKVGDENDNS